jgi:hypothetical protein
VAELLGGVMQYAPIAKKLRKAVRKMAEWIKVSERLPKPYETVLVFYRNGFNTFQCASEMLDEKGKMWSAVCGIPVTHWQPLPQPPEAE